MPPQAVIMQMVMGAWVTKVVSETTRLGVPDVVRKHGPMSAAEMVATGGVPAVPDALERLLRACASLGVLTEDAQGKFGPTELSEVLTSGSPGSVKKLVESVGGPWYKGWTEFYEAVKTGRSQSHRVFGLEWWDYLNANPKELEDFGEAMKANSQNSLRGVLQNCDFAGVATVADIAGGFGHLAIALAEKYPGLQAIVMDVPELIPVARKRMTVSDPAVAARLQYVGGNMFDSVPPADVYMLKHIIHDWDDDNCIRLLSNCRRSMRGDGRVICVDAVLPPMGNTGGTPAKLLDLQMLVFIPGRERTEVQWNNIYRAAGLEIKSITPVQDDFGTSIVEGVKHPDAVG
ncbi:MAG: acetylserotonin O-methyltransferase [Acidobacteriota bacterium]|nr:acetylserotonin O-methyltransferase [Acidobacteriota bacterium]